MRITPSQLAKLAVSYLPTIPPRLAARRLMLRANAARDARQWLLASAFYEEALRITPDARLHKQCGHMFKEAGDFSAASDHYLAAERLAPQDADLALQVGHFEKLRGDIAAARSAYQRALRLYPDWEEAREELKRLPATKQYSVSGPDETMLISELLPTEGEPARYRDKVHLHRLGRLALGPNGYGKALRGVESIRGYCTSAIPLTQISVSLGKTELTRQPLRATPLADTKHSKYAFNLWLDFSNAPRGDHVIELRLTDIKGRARIHRVAVQLLEPERESDFPDSDAIVDPPHLGDGNLVVEINTRPSMIRPTTRTSLPKLIDAILVQRIDQLGDLVVSVPALQRLRAIFPDARIVLLASQANADLARTFDFIDEVLVVLIQSQPDGRRTIAGEEQQRLRAALRERAFDLAIDFGQGAESRPLLRLSGAAYTAGFRTAAAPWLSVRFDLEIPDPANGLENCAPSQKLLALIEAVGCLHDPLTAALPRATDVSILRGYGLKSRPYVLLHAGARLEMNRWPFFAELVCLLLDQSDFDIVLMGMEPGANLPNDARVIPLNGLLPPSDFDALISGCTVFVGNDSGPKHLAALRAVPAISLHLARLNWAEWGQNGVGSIISRRVPCAGCAIERDPEDCGMDFACLRHIRPEEVLHEMLRLAACAK